MKKWLYFISLMLFFVANTNAAKSDFFGAREVNAAKAGSSWVYGAFKTQAKWANQFAKRGWTAEQVTEAVMKGEKFNAVNMVNKANSATRYVHPTTGRSVVIDNVTKELLQVGGDGFLW